MAEDVIARMRGRVQQLRTIKSLSHDPRVIDEIQNLIQDLEVDIRKLEAGGSGSQRSPSTPTASPK